MNCAAESVKCAKNLPDESRQLAKSPSKVEECIKNPFEIGEDVENSSNNPWGIAINRRKSRRMAEDSAENRNEVSSRFNQWVIADWVNRLTSSGGKCDLIADWIQKPDVRARVQPDGNQSPAGWRPDGENQSLTCNIRIYSPNGTLPDFRRVSKRLWSCFHALTDEFFFPVFDSCLVDLVS